MRSFKEIKLLCVSGFGVLFQRVVHSNNSNSSENGMINCFTEAVSVQTSGCIVVRHYV